MPVFNVAPIVCVTVKEKIVSLWTITLHLLNTWTVGSSPDGDVRGKSQGMWSVPDPKWWYRTCVVWWCQMISDTGICIYKMNNWRLIIKSNLLLFYVSYMPYPVAWRWLMCMYINCSLSHNVRNIIFHLFCYVGTQTV